ncbi:MAG: S46 family peptidase [Flavobacteriales bacterium]
MKKILILLIAVVSFSAVKANEGMWLVSLLNKMNEAEMKGLGLNLTAKDIYDINNASLKDAIVRLNYGSCTAEMISDQGLVLTNHHCAYDAIQTLAVANGDDYLTKGFWAYEKNQEMPIADFAVSFLERIEDVSERVLAGIDHTTSEEERERLIGERTKEIIGEAAAGGMYEPEVKSFFYGNEFYLMVYRTYTDVRLVGNPPEAIGKYGGDTDNWMWPRHTGDFSMLRIYADTDNNPAGYAETNKPYEPKHHLPVSTLGVEEGDYAMIMGYPGSTDRYLSSWGVKQAIDIANPTIVDIRDLKLKTMKSHMDTDPDVRLKYASKYAQVANYWKYFIGQTKGLKRLNVYGQKQTIERDFQQWANANPDRKSKYGGALKMIEDYYAATDASVKAEKYLLEAGITGSDIVLRAWRLGNGVQRAYNAEEKEWDTDMLERMKAASADMYSEYDMDLDKDLFVKVMNMYKENVPSDQLPEIFQTINGKYKGNVQKFADQLFDKSMFASQENFEAFIAKPKMKKFEKDMGWMFAESALNLYFAGFPGADESKFDVGYRLFVDGLRKMNPKTNYSPDANSTMRVSYGSVQDYFPADAIHYDYITTHKGILEKEDPTNPEFIVPAKLKELILAEDFGNYADANGDLIVCFLSDNDITGGNSGSPVINGDGHLIGLAFDGNWEAMSGDIAFEPELQRTISVDIRYVLFIIDKFAGATNLIEEMDLVTKKKAPKMAPQPEPEMPAEDAKQ